MRFSDWSSDVRSSDLRSGYNNSTGASNSALGTNAGRPATSTYDNWTCLGANSVVTGANQVQLGDSATTSYVYGTVQNRSDARDKADIRDTQLGLDFIKALRPVDYRWDMREDYLKEAIGKPPEDPLPPEKPTRLDAPIPLPPKPDQQTEKKQALTLALQARHAGDLL